MNLDKFKELALRETPKVSTSVHANLYRHNVIDGLAGKDNIGIELGVAQGVFSHRMVKSGKFKHFFGVDVYGDTHDTTEYKHALRKIGMLSNYKILRMTFDDAIDLFADHFFDFIYIDGFAHTGEEGGDTLVKWYKKLKVGGIMAGDDYHDNWPLVKWAVNYTVKQINVELNVTGKVETEAWCAYPSWFFIKESSNDDLLTSSKLLQEVANKERYRIYKKRMSNNLSIKTSNIGLLNSLNIKNTVKDFLRLK